MIYHQLGRTGLKVSQLGFGAMRLPMIGVGAQRKVNRDLSTPMIHRAFEAGVNYIDTAVDYCNSDSQRAVGDALKGWREKIIVSTKNPYYGEDEKQWWQNLQDSLERLGVDCIDIYNHHGINWKTYAESLEPRVSKWMIKARDQGLVKHICCSFHDDNEALMKIVDAGYVESITLQYNMLDRRLEEGIAHAHEKGLGVVVMGPVAGGRLGAPSEVLRKLIPGVERIVTMALSGMSTMRQVEENTATVSEAVSLSASDKAVIDKHLVRMEKMTELYCTGCGYCMPCPNDVNIPGIFKSYNYGRVYGLWDWAKKGYAHIGKAPWDKSKQADACVECGECEEKCPQKIPIREQLKEAHEALTGKDK